MRVPLLSDIVDVLLPPLCEVCGSPLPAGLDYICSACEAELPLCGRNGAAGDMSEMEERLADIPRLAAADAWMRYLPRHGSAGLVLAIKYGGARRLALWLGARMARDLTAAGLFSGVDALVPVPLHWRRRMKRGYNQSALLARGISRFTGLPVIEALRAGRHRSQTGLHGAERAGNVSGVYRLRRGADVRGLHLLLVDDVCTTGATLRDAASALDAGGCARVSAAALALTELL